MNRISGFARACAYALVANAVIAAPSATEDARKALAAGIDEVSAVLRERRGQPDLPEQLAPVTEKHFAFASTTRLAVGPSWREFTADERAKSTELFSRLMIKTYAERINGEIAPQIAYGTAVEIKTGRVEIPTQITNAGQTYAVTYRLELETASGRWRVYDVVAEGVSLISNYRSQFEPILQRGGAKALISTLEAKLAENSSR